MPENEIPVLPVMPMQQSLTFSSEIGELAKSLSLARKKFEKVVKDANNPFFKSKYADLSNIIEATAVPLAEQGLTVVQGPGRILEGRVELTTLLIHSSGQWIRCESEMLVSKPDAQGVGSALTYCRRYSEQSLLNVAGEDDDGNAASSKPVNKETDNEYDQRTEAQRVVMAAQAQAMHEAMKRTGKTEILVSDYLAKKGYKQFESVLRSDFQEILKWLNFNPDQINPSAKGTYSPAKASGGDLTKDLQKSLRDAINKKLWATAASASVPEGDVKKYAYETFAVDSMTALSAEQLKSVVHWLETMS